MKFSALLTLNLFSVISFFGNTQVQLGGDIDGETANNSSGWSVSMPSGSVVAIGAPSNDDNGTTAGHVRVFDYTANGWSQRGSDLDGRTSFDKAGYDVEMPNTATVGFGVPGEALSTGRVEVHTWNGSSWVQKGSDIVGLSIGERFGYVLSMPDENTVALGTQGASNYNQNLSGKVFVYEWDGSSWAQKGGQILGENSNDRFGYDVSMPSPNVVAISTPFNDEAGADAGHVRIYDWNGSDWVQRGSDIDGANAGENFGWSISMGDENTIAVGSPKASGNGLFYSGTVKIYNWNGSTWVQKGNTMNGEFVGESFGYSLSMPSATTVGGGARYTGESFTNSGSARVFQFDGTSWSKVGSSMNGEAQDDESGFALSMGDGNTIAIGSIRNEGNGNDAGHVRVYALNGTSSIHELNWNNKLVVNPNPSSGSFNLEITDDSEYKLYTLQGKCVFTGYAAKGKTIIQTNLEDGFYMLYCSGNAIKVQIKR